MKSNKNAHKKSFIKRLFEESLILSCLGKISSRLIYFFKVSIFSFLLTDCDTVDNALERGAASRGVNRIKLKQRFIRPLKYRFSLSVENSLLAGLYRRGLQRALYTPVSTYGAFLATLGIYIGLVYFVKLYAFFATDISVASLVTACVVFLCSVPLLFCGKPLITAVSESAVISTLLSGCIDFSAYNGKKRSAAVGSAIILGSVSGVLTFFCGEWRILALICAAIYLLMVLHSPELGLFSVVLLFPFVPRPLTCAMVLITFAFYILKVLRGKRNLHFGTAGVFVAMLGIGFLFVYLKGGGQNALFALCMCLVYCLAANLLCTPKLLRKCVRTLVTGFSVALAIYALQVFNAAYSGHNWYGAIVGSFSVFATADRLACYALLLLPFVFCKSKNGSFIKQTVSYLLMVACIIYSVVIGYTALAVLSAAAIALYLAVDGCRLFRPLVLCFGLPVMGLYFASGYIPYNNVNLFAVMENWMAALKAGSAHFFTGVGMSAASVTMAFGGDSSSMYFQTLLECGISGLLLLVLATAFSTQRIYTQLSPTGTENRSITAAAGAAALICLTVSMGENLWADPSLCVIYWLCLGLASAAYTARQEEQRGMYDEKMG